MDEPIKIDTFGIIRAGRGCTVFIDGIEAGMITDVHIKGRESPVIVAVEQIIEPAEEDVNMGRAKTKVTNYSIGRDEEIDQKERGDDLIFVELLKGIAQKGKERGNKPC